MRGTTRYLIGLVDSVESASIWSVTRMVPISAAMAAPIRPATISAGDHRAQFARDREHDHRRDRACGAKAAEAGIGLQRQHHAGEDRSQADDRQRVIADIDHLPADEAQIDTAAGRRG